MGKPAPFFQMGIVGQNGEELRDGEEGELAIRTDKGAGSCWIFKGASFTISTVDSPLTAVVDRLRQEWQG